MQLFHTSEFSLLCLLPPPASLEQQQRIWLAAEQAEQFEHVREVVVGMNNFTLYHDIEADTVQLKQQVHQLWQQIETQSVDYQGKLVEIPVQYGGEFGEDLHEVARYHHTTPKEIIRRHTASIYTVFMMGFQPGFPYLGGLPEHLHTPRKAVPRTRVPAGSVGIGGSQTGIYPLTSPGGWQLLGRTKMALFDLTQQPPVLLQAGDRVRFMAESIEL